MKALESEGKMKGKAIDVCSGGGGRGEFCPLLATRGTVGVVCGGKEGTVEVHILKEKEGEGWEAKRLNTLAGHRADVTDVSWSYDETLLASADKEGTVIVWKRTKNI